MLEQKQDERDTTDDGLDEFLDDVAEHLTVTLDVTGNAASCGT